MEALEVPDLATLKTTSTAGGLLDSELHLKIPHECVEAAFCKGLPKHSVKLKCKAVDVACNNMKIGWSLRPSCLVSLYPIRGLRGSLHRTMELQQWVEEIRKDNGSFSHLSKYER